MPDAGPTLVLGATGFLGVALLRAVTEAGLGPLLAVGRRARDLGGARSLALDAEAPGALERALAEHRPVRVLLAAALARGADCARDPARARRLNAELPARVAAWCAAHGARLVHVSTDLVFGARVAPPGGFAEQDPAAPLDTYARTKLAGERAVLERCPRALVARLPLLFGDSRGRGLGASDAVADAVRAGERPRLFVDEYRTPLDVDDAARALVELARCDARGLLHLAGPERLSRHALGLLALEAAGLDPARACAAIERATRAEVRAGPPRAADTSLDAARARALLTTPLRAPREALERGRA